MPTAERLRITMPLLHPGQWEVHQDHHRFRVLACGRRWGKTLLGAALSIEAAATGGHVWWIAPTFPIASVGWRAIKQLVLQIPGSEIREVERIATLPGGGWIQVRSADNPDSLRGEGLDLVVFDECAFIAEEAWTEAIRPALADRKGKALFISTPKGRNWFWKLWNLGNSGDPEWKSWQLPTIANPYIDPLEIEAARANMPARTFSQEHEADFANNEGVFFPEWSERLHVVAPFPIPQVWLRWTATDWGYADPFCTLWFARDPTTRRIYVYREVYERGLREEQQAALIRQRSGDEKIAQYVADPSMWNARAESGRPSIASIYHLNKVPIIPAGNSRIAGWQTVRRALAGDEPRLQVFATCRNLIRTMPEMVHDPLDVEDLADAIKGQKTEDHCLTGDTLVDTEFGPVALQSLCGTVGNLYGPDGRLHPYRDARLTRRQAPIVEVLFDDGRSLKATADHRLLVQDDAGIRWNPVSNLLPGDQVVDVGHTIRYNKVCGGVPYESDRGQSNDSGIRGSALLAVRPLFPAGRQETASHGVGIRERSGSFGLSRSPQGQGSFEQPTRELRGCADSNPSQWTFIDSRGAGTGSEAHARGDRSSQGMAPLGDRASLAYAGRSASVGGTSHDTEDLHYLREGLRDSVSNPFAVLREQLPPEGGPHSSTARIREVRPAGVADTFNLDVETVHSFSVAGGLIVHNCLDPLRYGLVAEAQPRTTTGQIDFAVTR